MKANIGSLPSSAFTAKCYALLDTPSTKWSAKRDICHNSNLSSVIALAKLCTDILSVSP